MPKEIMQKLSGYDPDIAKSRAEAQKIMQTLGYGPDKHLAVKISARNLAIYRDPAAILADQLKNIWIDAELDLVETANWLPKLVRVDFVMPQSFVDSGLDDPDQNFYENYICDSNRNYTHSCDRELDKLIDQQSAESDQEKRRRLVSEIDRRLQGPGGAPDPLPHASGDLLAARGQRPQHSGQQHLQRLAHGR